MTRLGIWTAIVAVAMVGAAALKLRTGGAKPMTADFTPTVENRGTPPGPPPEGMVWIPGGEFSMGAQDPHDPRDTIGMQATQDSRPIHRVYVDGFWMDKTEVTNAQF